MRTDKTPGTRDILQIIATANVGGGRQHLLYIINGLKPTDFRLHVIYSTDGALSNVIHDAEIKIKPLDIFKYKTGLKLVNEFRKYIRKYDIKYIHCHGTRSGLFGAIAGKLESTKVIYTAHVLSYNKTEFFPFKALYFLMEKLICTLADMTISVSSFDRDVLINKHITAPEKVSIINNGIDLDKYAKIPGEENKYLFREFPALRGKKIAIMVARFVKQKGIFDFVETVRIIARKRDDVAFVLVGSGFLFEKVQKLIRRYGLEDRLILTGVRKDINNLLSIADIFVLTSYWEGLPLTVLEAMAAKLPVVITSVNGNIELVRDGINGFLVKRGKVYRFVKYIDFLLNNPEVCTRMGTKNREDVKTNYNILDKTKELIEVYNNVFSTDNGS